MKARKKIKDKFLYKQRRENEEEKENRSENGARCNPFIVSNKKIYDNQQAAYS